DPHRRAVAGVRGGDRPARPGPPRGPGRLRRAHAAGRFAAGPRGTRARPQPRQARASDRCRRQRGRRGRHDHCARALSRARHHAGPARAVPRAGLRKPGGRPRPPPRAARDRRRALPRRPLGDPGAAPPRARVLDAVGRPDEEPPAPLLGGRPPAAAAERGRPRVRLRDRGPAAAAPRAGRPAPPGALRRLPVRGARPARADRDRRARRPDAPARPRAGLRAELRPRQDRSLSARGLVASFAGLLLTSSALAQQPPPVRGDAVFPVAAQLVWIDAVAVDSEDQPVATLDAEDFEVVERGARQPIILFRPPDLDATGRAVVFLIEDAFARDWHVDRARDLVARAAAKATPGDRVVLVAPAS